MRHSIFTICLVLLTFNKVYCQNKTSIENSIFWQVVSDTKKDTSYIFGTVHLIDKARFYLPSEVLNALSKCKALYLEVNEDPDPAELLALTRLKNESIFDFLSPEQKDSVLNFSENTLKIDSETFSNFYAGFKPFVFTHFHILA